MNHIYKTVFNASLGTWIAVSELAKGKHKTSVCVGSSVHSNNTHSAIKIAPTLLTTVLLSLSTNIYALPTGNELVAGQATVSTPSATQMQINQASDRAVINWQGFSVGQNEALHIQ